MKVTDTKLTDVKIVEMDVLAIIAVSSQKVIQKQNLQNMD